MPKVEPKIDPRVSYLKRLLDRKGELAELDGESDNEGYKESILEQPEDLETRQIPRFGDEEAGPALPRGIYGMRQRDTTNPDDLQHDLSLYDLVVPAAAVERTPAAAKQKPSERPVQSETAAATGAVVETPAAEMQESSDKPPKFRRRAGYKQEPSGRPTQDEAIAGTPVGTATATRQESSESGPSVN